MALWYDLGVPQFKSECWKKILHFCFAFLLFLFPSTIVFMKWQNHNFKHTKKTLLVLYQIVSKKIHTAPFQLIRTHIQWHLTHDSNLIASFMHIHVRLDYMLGTVCCQFKHKIEKCPASILKFHLIVITLSPHSLPSSQLFSSLACSSSFELLSCC